MIAIRIVTIKTSFIGKLVSSRSAKVCQKQIFSNACYKFFRLKDNAVKIFNEQAT